MRLLLLMLSMLPPISANQNRSPAGVLNNGVLTIAIDAREGTWYPDSDKMPGIAAYAFGEAGKALEIPGPLIRVPAGTKVRMRLTNHIGKTLRVAGLYSRPYLSGDTVVRVAPNESQDIEFTLDSPGTYYYWGTANDSALNRRVGNDSQLAGAIVVDERGAMIKDRIFVITEWVRQLRPGTNIPAEGTLLISAINGKSWPHTERFKQQVGDTLNWKFINASIAIHPMHLHGFYFRLDGLGDNRRDTTFTADHRRMAVTERVALGGTMNVTWVPDRGGNWLFHCHVPAHVHPHGSLDDVAPGKAAGHVMNHTMEGMAGLVLGVEVSGNPVARTSKARIRKLRLVASAAGNSMPARPSYQFAFDKPDAMARSGIGATLNPVIVVRKGEPVAITVVNELNEPTAVHWHGIELESYYDGVAGFGGAGKRIAPSIMPRDSFVAQFIPPRAGTFIYHTHIDERAQEPAGLSGVLVVTEPERPFDLRYDHPVLITTTRERELDNFYVNNSLQPPPMEWKVGEKHRFRVVDMMIAPPSGVTVRMLRDTTVMMWRTVAKDGMTLPEPRTGLRPAVLRATIGETHDVEVVLTEPGDYKLEVRLTAAPAVRVRTIDIHVRE